MFQDLIQEGCVVLIRRVETFDGEKRLIISAHEKWWIRQTSTVTEAASSSDRQAAKFKVIIACMCKDGSSDWYPNVLNFIATIFHTLDAIDMEGNWGYMLRRRMDARMMV